MTALPTQLPGERVKKALEEYCLQKKKSPDADHLSILHQVELKFDLTPLECEFLNRQLLEGGQ